MKKTLALLGIAAVVLLSAPSAYADHFPKPKGYVNDFADVISAGDEKRLEAELKAYDDKTSTQVAVATVRSLQGRSIEQYSYDLASEWGIGQKGKDNGILLLVALNERKVRIEVGYGLEGTMPDAIAKRIIERVIIPEFKAGDLPGGIAAGTAAILTQLESPGADEFTNDGGGNSCEGCGQIVGLVFVGIAALVLLIFLVVVLGRKYSAWRERVRAHQQRVAEARAAWEDIRADLGDSQGVYETLMARQGDAHPKRLSDAFKKLVAERAALLEQFETADPGVSDEIDRKPELVLEPVEKIASLYSALEVHVAELTGSLNDFDSAKASYNGQLVASERKIKSVLGYLKKLDEMGYRVEITVGPARDLLEDAQAFAKSSKPDFIRVVELAKEAAQVASSHKEHYERLLEIEKSNEQTIAELSVWRDAGFKELVSEGNALFAKMQTGLPKELWQKPVAAFNKAAQAIQANGKDMLSDGERLNSKTEQKFEAAEKRIGELVSLKLDLTEAVKHLSDTIRDYEREKADTESLANRARSAISNAEGAMSDSDSGDAGRSDLTRAKRTLRDAVYLAGTVLPNWLAVNASLRNAVDLAQKAESDAEDEARRVRRRREEEEEAAARRLIQVSSYSSSSSWSSGSSSSGSDDSSSSFGGFGGGSFGGGGASGGW